MIDINKLSILNNSEAEINVSNMRYAEYQRIAVLVNLRVLEDLSIVFESLKDDAATRTVIRSGVIQERARVREIISKSDRPNMSEDDFIEGYTQRNLTLWLKSMALSKVPVVVSEINGFHLIAAIKGKGFPDKEIDATDFVLSNYLHELAVTMRECNLHI
ncbi:MAG: hypothetical protein Q7K26_00560 [bacterium]|nr:hypothetical protein [bacterium]